MAALSGPLTLPPVRSITLPTGRATYLMSEQGASSPVLLLHGGGLDCATLSWRYLFPALAPDRTVVALNWPGYGGSDAFGRPYTIADLGKWLLAFLDALQIERAALVGVSMGGGAALWATLHHPERVTRLVPVASYGLAARAPYQRLSYLAARLPVNRLSYAVMRRSHWALRRALAAIFADPGKVTEAIVTEVQGVLDSAANARAFSDFQKGELTPGGLRTVLTPELAHIKQPTLFIHGRDDSLIPLADVERAAAAMPNARLAVLDAGHWPMRECPDAFNRLVEAFLRETGSPV